MAKRPRKKAAKARRGPKKPAKRGEPDPLDAFVAAAAHALELPCPAAWRPGIRENVRVTLQLAEFVAAFPLPDDAEPAPVFEA